MDCTDGADWHRSVFLFQSCWQPAVKKSASRRIEVSIMEFITIRDISKYLKVKESTLYSWVHNGSIPFYKLNGLLRFDMDEIETWVKASKPMSCNRDIKLKKPPNQDIEKVVKKAIDSVKGNRYNRSNGKPGQIKVSERRFYGTV